MEEKFRRTRLRKHCTYENLSNTAVGSLLFVETRGLQKHTTAKEEALSVMFQVRVAEKILGPRLREDWLCQVQAQSQRPL